jgi:hypothetical protein
MRVFRSRIHQMADWRRQGVVHCVLATSLLLAATLCSLSLEYWSNRTFHLVATTFNGMTWESYRNLALITVFLGWVLSRTPERQTTHRRPFRP